MMLSMKSSFSAVVLLLLSVTTATRTSTANQEQCRSTDTKYNVPQDCSVVMAPSSNGGFGMFALQPRPKGSPVMFGDVAIHLPDVLNARGMGLFQEYWWSSEETGGMAEGKKVHSVLPGVAMLANAGGLETANVLPYRPNKDDAECARESCKAAGSFSQYYNYTFFAHKEINAGQEFIVKHSPEWLEDHDMDDDDDDSPDDRSVEWLRQHGICLDNIMPSQSKMPHGSRGAFSTRFLPQNSVVAPVPVLPIFDWMTSLKKLVKGKGKKKGMEQRMQLLLNYCLGHPQSSMLLFPYSPIVNFVNHNRTSANVKLQWSQHSSLSFDNKEWLGDLDLDDLEDTWDYQKSGLLLELVALRDISQGEEIVLDYGSDWQASWESHSLGPYEGMYTPAMVMDEVASKIRTQPEQVGHPYTSNVETSCFYDYQNSSSSTVPSGGVNMIPWNWTRHVFDWKNLRPCSVLQRDDASMLYAVKIRNRPGISNPVPKMHIVKGVPRPAIRFTDKIYTTDQHLPDAFRKFISIPDDIFPEQWRDAANDEDGEDD